MVRTDANLVKIDSFYSKQTNDIINFGICNTRDNISAFNPSENIDLNNIKSFETTQYNCDCCEYKKTNQISRINNFEINFIPLVETKCQLTSVTTLINSIKSSENIKLNLLFKKIIFIGIIDDQFSICQVSFNNSFNFVNHHHGLIIIIIIIIIIHLKFSTKLLYC